MSNTSSITRKILLFANAIPGNSRDVIWSLVKNALITIDYAEAQDIIIWHGVSLSKPDLLANLAPVFYDEIWFMNELNSVVTMYTELKQLLFQACKQSNIRTVLLWDDTSTFAPSQDYIDQFDKVAHVHDLGIMSNTTGLRPKAKTMHLPYPVLGRPIDSANWPDKANSLDKSWDLVYCGYYKPDRVLALATLMASPNVKTMTVGGITLGCPSHVNATATVKSDELRLLLSKSKASLYLVSPGQEGQITSRLLESLEAGCPVLLGPKTGLKLSKAFPVVSTAEQVEQAIDKIDLHLQISEIKAIVHDQTWQLRNRSAV